jgi:DNA invertase Pin-like site-specific DNA recombinase
MPPVSLVSNRPASPRYRDDARAGVKAAQKRGVKFGPKVKLTPDRLAHARKLIQQGTRTTDAAKIIGIGRATLYCALQRESHGRFVQ